MSGAVRGGAGLTGRSCAGRVRAVVLGRGRARAVDGRVAAGGRAGAGALAGGGGDGDGGDAGEGRGGRIT